MGSFQIFHLWPSALEAEAFVFSTQADAHLTSAHRIQVVVTPQFALTLLTADIVVIVATAVVAVTVRACTAALMHPTAATVNPTTATGTATAKSTALHVVSLMVAVAVHL